MRLVKKERQKLTLQKLIGYLLLDQTLFGLVASARRTEQRRCNHTFWSGASNLATVFYIICNLSTLPLGGPDNRA